MNDQIKSEKLEALTQAQLSEAPASLNFFAITKKGWNLQITLRDVDEFNLLTRFAKLVQHLESVEVTPKQVGPQAGQAPIPSNGSQAAADALTFAADKLVINFSDGKKTFKVKGGKFSKYGVTVYSEVLEAAGFDADALDPSKPIDLTGYTAHYGKYEFEGKEVTKVTKLVK